MLCPDQNSRCRHTRRDPAGNGKVTQFTSLYKQTAGLSVTYPATGSVEQTIETGSWQSFCMVSLLGPFMFAGGIFATRRRDIVLRLLAAPGLSLLLWVLISVTALILT